MMWLGEPGSMIEQAKWCPVEYTVPVTFIPVSQLEIKRFRYMEI
jgi:hypothetical protein